MLSDEDRHQYEELLKTKQQLRTLIVDAGGDPSQIDQEIADIHLILNPIPSPPEPPANLRPQLFRKEGDLEWPVFWYCGGWYLAPEESDHCWNQFVLSVGQSVATDKNLHKPRKVE